MFLGILNWMLAHVPGFMRPGVSWLVDALRRITGHISNLWNMLGASAGVLYVSIANWRTRLAIFVVAVSNGFWWVRNVYIPQRLNALLQQVLGAISQAVALVHNTLLQVIYGLERWVSDRLHELGRLANSILTWAANQLARVDAFITLLVNALRHVTSGPAVLAEWLLSAMYHAALARLQQERDRIFVWLFRGAPSFTVWLARILEDMIVRLL